MIIYFTGTGNSRYVAEYIGILTSDEVISANDYIKNGTKAKFESDKPYVFVSPTYGWRIPRIFSDFITEGTFKGNKNAYFIMTCGTGIGNAGAYIRKLCSRVNFQYKGVAQILMPENYIALFNVPDEAEAKRIIATANEVIKNISCPIKNEETLPTFKYNILSDLQSRIVNPIFYSFIVSAKGFSVPVSADIIIA